MSIAYIWEYTVKDDSVDEFLAAYGSDGDWVKLFASDPEYVETKLLRDENHPYRFLTIDYWTSKESFEAFKKNCRAEYTAIDARCERLTESERFVGEFDFL